MQGALYYYLSSVHGIVYPSRTKTVLALTMIDMVETLTVRMILSAASTITFKYHPSPSLGRTQTSKSQVTRGQSSRT